MAEKPFGKRPGRQPGAALTAAETILRFKTQGAKPARKKSTDSRAGGPELPQGQASGSAVKRWINTLLDLPEAVPTWPEYGGAAR